MAIVTVTYTDRKTGAYAGTDTYYGKDLNEAMVLAANYQSAHPELLADEVKGETKR